MLDLTPWAERISTSEITAVLAADLDAAQNSRRFPVLALVPGRDKITTAPLSQGTRHRVTAQVLVVSGVGRGNQALGEQMVDRLAGLRRMVVHRLVGWTPPPVGISVPDRTWYDYSELPVMEHDTEVSWAGGQLLSMSQNAVYWVDAFTTDYWWSP
ncbi:MAG: hypothetical protein R3175_07495 [Marinobacter sp.]|uniref:phage tail terminator protein n=1 Tax=Marinobacter sp. TaxID=50741 RepID=UPI00299F074E|nr:hypothetical protein [Marinobacter sp.]MDX1755884.1 hypothetical protein [Marinobacter sp.]